MELNKIREMSEAELNAELTKMKKDLFTKRHLLNMTSMNSLIRKTAIVKIIKVSSLMAIPMLLTNNL